MIPKEFTDEYIERSKDILFYGKRLEELSRDELKAIIVFAFDERESAIKRNKIDRDILSLVKPSLHS